VLCSKLHHELLKSQPSTIVLQAAYCVYMTISQTRSGNRQIASSCLIFAAVSVSAVAGLLCSCTWPEDDAEHRTAFEADGEVRPHAWRAPSQPGVRAGQRLPAGRLTQNKKTQREARLQIRVFRHLAVRPASIHRSLRLRAELWLQV
jgi:hypothetical protein